MKRYAVTEAQLNANGAIGHINVDYGTNESAARGHYYSALASGLASGLIACTVTINVMDDETGVCYAQSNSVKGTGTYTPPEETEPTEQEGEL